MKCSTHSIKCDVLNCINTAKIRMIFAGNDYALCNHHREIIMAAWFNSAFRKKKCIFNPEVK